jgi:hypothetical protein
VKRFNGAVAVVSLVSVVACSGAGSNAMMPAPNGAAVAGSGNVNFKIFVPATQNNGVRNPIVMPTAGIPMAGNAQSFGSVGLPVTGSGGGPTAPGTPGPPGSQTLAISVNGPAAISQTITVGPNANGCAPVSGGTSCQVSLSMPAGTYSGTVGAPNGNAATAVAFTVTPSGQNLFSLATGGAPAQVQVVASSALATSTAQNGIDFYGGGRHPVVVEALDANQNVIVGSLPGNYSLNVSGGALAATVSQTPGTAPNLFNVTFGATASTAPAFLRATVNYAGPLNPCAQPSAVCTGSVRIDDRQLIGIANVSANDVTMYVNGQNAPFMTIASGIAAPQALAFDVAGNLFVANQPASVTEYAPPYTAAPATIVSGVNHPQALAVDARGDLFVANGSGSNTVTVYSPPYNGPPQATISSGIDDPVDLALDGSSNLYVVNQARNTVAIYAPPYAAAPTILSKGLNAPNSLALDARGNLFVTNLNSTPNSVIEFSPPFSAQSEPVVTITNGVNEQGQIGIGGSANLFVPNQGANTVTEYVAPYTKAPITIAGGQSQPVALAIDAAANLYVANLGNNTVTEYAAPYGGGSWTAISNGISQPVALALSPASGSGLSLVP